jgi:uncharacterized protein YabN with tetrapyrrole methylase and pyrophosphatase domain
MRASPPGNRPDGAVFVFASRTTAHAAAALREKPGCPWARDQKSLKPYLISHFVCPLSGHEKADGTINQDS